MGLIYKQLTFTGSKGVKALKALMDSGASRCFIRKTEAQDIAHSVKVPPFIVELGKGQIAIEEAAALAVHLNGYALPWIFYIFPDLTEEVIIGADFFQTWNIKLDLASEDFIIDPEAFKIKLV